MWAMEPGKYIVHPDAVSHRYHERGVRMWETSTTGDCATWGHRSKASTRMNQQGYDV